LLRMIGKECALPVARAILSPWLHLTPAAPHLSGCFSLVGGAARRLVRAPATLPSGRNPLLANLLLAREGQVHPFSPPRPSACHGPFSHNAPYRRTSPFLALIRSARGDRRDHAQPHRLQSSVPFLTTLLDPDGSRQRPAEPRPALRAILVEQLPPFLSDWCA